jgi:hypothetical protein
VGAAGDGEDARGGVRAVQVRERLAAPGCSMVPRPEGSTAPTQGTGWAAAMQHGGLSRAEAGRSPAQHTPTTHNTNSPSTMKFTKVGIRRLGMRGRVCHAATTSSFLRPGTVLGPAAGAGGAAALAAVAVMLMAAALPLGGGGTVLLLLLLLLEDLEDLTTSPPTGIGSITRDQRGARAHVRSSKGCRRQRQSLEWHPVRAGAPCPRRSSTAATAYITQFRRRLMRLASCCDRQRVCRHICPAAGPERTWLCGLAGEQASKHARALLLARFRLWRSHCDPAVSFVRDGVGKLRARGGIEARRKAMGWRRGGGWRAEGVAAAAWLRPQHSPAVEAAQPRGGDNK